MTIVFVSNYLNHHQAPLADALFNTAGVEYTFVATKPVPQFRKELGYSELKRDYLLDTTLSEANRIKALHLVETADVVIFRGGFTEEFEIPRLKLKKLSFEYSERRFKKGYINLLSPHLFKHQMMYYLYGRKAPVYMLCSSAYASYDFHFMRSFINRCYKWAYFTKVEDLDIESILINKRQPKCRILWCSRFVDWKHPELVIDLAKRLKSESLEFEIDMYGKGPLLEKYRQIIDENNISDCVYVKGSLKNDDILQEMRRHNIFLFTSDQNEGWGAVANEAMSNGCTLVGSDMVGAVPFLVNDKVNGRIFKSKEIESLYQVTKQLIEDRDLCEAYAREAYLNMKNNWSPEVAANRFIRLVDCITNNKPVPFTDGPCSKAEPKKSYINKL